MVCMVLIFNEFQWQTNSIRSLKYLIYEWTFAAYFNFVLILSIYTASDCKQLEFYIIYLTNWNVMLNALSSLFGAIFKTLHYNNKITFIVNTEPDKHRMTKILKVHWLLSNLSTVVSICVSLAYWPSYNGRDAGLNDFLTHAGNSVVLFADTFIHARPARYGHFIYPFSFGIVYVIVFSLPYQLLGGLNRDYKNYIYPSLDWTDNTKIAVTSATMLLGSLVIVHFFIMVSINARLHLYSKYKAYNDASIPKRDNCREQSIV